MVTLLPAALATAALAAEPQAPGDPLLDSLATWAERSFSELALDGAPRPSRTTFAAVDLEHYEAQAAFGALVAESGHRRRPARVEVVVGDDALDSSRFQASDPTLRVVGRPSLVIEDQPAALERDLWLAADQVYKSALAQRQVKQVALDALGGEPPPPDWTAAMPSQAVDMSPIPAVDAALLREIALQASARFREVPGLREGTVEVRAWDGRYYLATSSGTRLAQPEGYAVVYARADLLRPDGVLLDDHRQWVARSAEELPALEVIADEAEAMARGLRRRADAPVVDSYEGPVVFEGRAAADLLRYLLPPEICGTPPAPSPHQSYQQLIRSGPRLGRRLLPQGWTVQDDPLRPLPGLAGGFAYDREGVPAQAVEPVRDGYVRDLLMSRVPRHDLQRSNGHARGSIQGSWVARPSLWEVTPDRRLSERAFQRQVERALKASGAERVLVVRGLSLGRPGTLPRPTEAVWLREDGSETPVASLQFQRVDRRVLRDILAAGGAQQTHAYLAPWSLRSHADGDTGLPSVLIAPERLLVSELEAVFPGADERPHSYAMPAFP